MYIICLAVAGNRNWSTSNPVYYWLKCKGNIEIDYIQSRNTIFNIEYILLEMQPLLYILNFRMTRHAQNLLEITLYYQFSSTRTKPCKAENTMQLLRHTYAWNVCIFIKCLVESDPKNIHYTLFHQTQPNTYNINSKEASIGFNSCILFLALHDMVLVLLL